MEKAEDADDGALGGMEKRAATHLRALFANNVPVCVRLHGQGRDLLGKPLDTPHCQCPTCINTEVPEDVDHVLGVCPTGRNSGHH